MLGYRVPDTVSNVGSGLVQVSAYIGALLVIFGFLFHSKSPIRRVLAWLVRRNITEPFVGKAREVLTTTVQPMIAAESEITRAASRAQHDEQNVHISALSDRVGVIEQHITRPRTERERKDDS